MREKKNYCSFFSCEKKNCKENGEQIFVKHKNEFNIY